MKSLSPVHVYNILLCASKPISCVNKIISLDNKIQFFFFVMSPSNNDVFTSYTYFPLMHYSLYFALSVHTCISNTH